jgi:DEP domain-containing protein 5
MHGIPSDAPSGNFLEAINSTLNFLDKHYIDRDLARTGNSIVMISAGTGIFRVRPGLQQITKQRMMDNGIGMDFISLSQPPLHTVPLFLIECSNENGIKVRNQSLSYIN